jgi:hypothetical protein
LSCSSCPPGKYFLIGTAACVNCEAGTYATIASSSCANCCNRNVPRCQRFNELLELRRRHRCAIARCCFQLGRFISFFICTCPVRFLAGSSSSAACSPCATGKYSVQSAATCTM